VSAATSATISEPDLFKGRLSEPELVAEMIVERLPVFFYNGGFDLNPEQLPTDLGYDVRFVVVHDSAVHPQLHKLESADQLANRPSPDVQHKKLYKCIFKIAPTNALI
jgi:hypothetical protein